MTPPTPTPTKASPGEMVERLQEESRALQSRAWSRQDGGQELSISANLLDEAAAQLSAAQDRVARLLDLVSRAYEELRLIKMKDSNALYDIGLRSALAQALADTATEVKHG